MNGQEAQITQPTENPMEPVDLASAFKILNKANREAAQEPVATEEPAPSGDEPGAEPASVEPGAEGAGEIGEQMPAADVGGDDGGVGGSATGIEAIDFDAGKQALLRNIQRQSIIEVQREFKEQNIGKYSMKELKRQDEATGRVHYRNPDVPSVSIEDERRGNVPQDYWFKSMAEAQAFIDTWNKGVDEEFRAAINQKQYELVQQNIPTIKMIEFAPKYNAMDEQTQQVFDALIEPYAIKDANGKEIGFNVDYDAMAKQAAALVKKFGFQQQQPEQASGAQQQQKAASSPAVDMKTGNGKSSVDPEPKTIGEALKMFDQMNRSKK